MALSGERAYQVRSDSIGAIESISQLTSVLIQIGSVSPCE